MKRNSPYIVLSSYSWFQAALAVLLLLGTGAAQRNTGIIAGRASGIRWSRP